MEVDFIAVDESSKAFKERAQQSSSSCSTNESTTTSHLSLDTMATTAASPPAPIRIFREPSSNSPMQLYGSAGLSFASTQSHKVRINKHGYNHQPSPAPPRVTAATQDDGKKRYSAQVAPFSRSFGGSTDSLPHLDGMVICPHLHPLSPNSASIQSPATFFTPASISEEKEVTVHTLDTRVSETTDECWSPLAEEDDMEHARITAATRGSESPPSLTAPLLDHLESERSNGELSEEDPRYRVFSRGGYMQQEASGIEVSSWGGAGGERHPLHRPLTRQWQRPSQSIHERMSKSTLIDATNNSVQNKKRATSTKAGLLLIAPDQDTPFLLGKTKPVPPPKTPPSEIERRCDSPSSPDPQSYSVQQTSPQRRRHHSKFLKSTVSSPAIFAADRSPPQHHRGISFRHCKAGEEQGQFRADYLGSKDVDSYISVVNSVAKQLVDQRPAEVIAYVSSQKIRLAPSQNENVLFKSFAVKDILMVEKCTINKRIIGIIVWKQKSHTPTCHILRCHDELVSKAFYEAVWEQSQIYDDVNLSKIDARSSSSPSGSPKHRSDLTLSDVIEDSPGGVSSSGSSSSAESSTSSSGSSPSYREVPGFSAREVLHRFPATYIGEAVAGKLHSIDDVIQKVLVDSRPTLSKELVVCLSLAEVKFVEMRGEEEVVCMTHETSRIRAIGVYSQDKRFMGYIIKEEGKPLMSYVLRCNSAALMVQLVSFLRQSCQLTFYQRGGSFYDELAADDADDCDYIIDGSAGLCDSMSFVKRLRSITMSLSQRTSLSTVSRPSFQSHTQLHKKLSPAHDIPQRRRDSINSPTIFSPFDFTEEDYAKFRVTYIGSAALEPPMTQRSVVDAMNKFSECGIAAGQAAVAKNSINMQVSALGINLSDKKHKLFINRNYPRKQLEGYCAHPTDDSFFAFASRRPGYSSSLKVHVFKRGSESVEQILGAVNFWLEIEPITV